jgi:hypothetical protein
MHWRVRVVRAGVLLLRPLAALWPSWLRRAAGAEREQVLAELLEATWAERGGAAAARRWLFEAADALVLGLRLRGRVVRVTVAVAALAAVVLVAERLKPAAEPALLLVEATDPAGEFTLTLRGGRLVAATVDRVAYPAAQLEQTRDSLRVRDAAGRAVVAVEFVAPATIRWSPRPAEGT